MKFNDVVARTGNEKLERYTRLARENVARLKEQKHEGLKPLAPSNLDVLRERERLSRWMAPYSVKPLTVSVESLLDGIEGAEIPE